MTWSPLVAQCFNETAKTRWRAVPFTAGRGLDVGCGQERLFDTEFCVGVDDGSGDGSGKPPQANIKLNAKDMSSLAAGQWDYVYSSYLLHLFPYADVPNLLREWLRLVKTNGTLVLYLPDASVYPKVAEPELGVVAEPGANAAQKWNVTYERLVLAMQKTHWNWDLCYFEHCSTDDECSLFAVFRKLK
jgi:SAM-dependent methyltransferase